MTAIHEFFVTAPKGLEGQLADELRELDCPGAAERRAGAVFTGDLETAYRVCLWSRIANRVLLPLKAADTADADDLYQVVGSIDWREHLTPRGTLAVDYNGPLAGINHTHFGVQRVKDAIVDQLREQTGQRPSIDPARPDLRVNVYLHHGKATISIDLTGDSLHRRGYRATGGTAPLKENLAAAIIRRAGWQELAAGNGVLVDPMCGSGTLVIEAGMMAADIAPGLQRGYWGFDGWRGHAPDIWAQHRDEAGERARSGALRPLRLYGFDADPRMIHTARENSRLAGLGDRLQFNVCRLEDLKRPGSGPGLVAVNPPYGKRLGDGEALPDLYHSLGRKLLQEFEGWKATVLTSDIELGRALGLRAHKVNKVYNGALECHLLQLDIRPDRAMQRAKQVMIPAAPDPELLESEGARMFANRLRKNLRTIGKWAERRNLGCYRLYDADIPEYAIALDRYEDWLHVQEYAPPRGVDRKQAGRRLREMLAVILKVLDCPPDRVVVKHRERQHGRSQYPKLAASGQNLEIAEQDARLLVNLHDYLDTGLFLDHRPTRTLIRDSAAGRRFLNLFAYTGTATVYAALGGARSTTSVDLSRTYLDWARRNLELNGIPTARHEFIQADCLEWLAEHDRSYDLIFLDPPTFSNSKRMRESFDIQRDHVELIQRATALLSADGILLFSCNRRRFKLDETSLQRAIPGIKLEDITDATLPRDFARRPPIHHCWRISKA